MEEKRQGEIALKLVKHLIRERGITLTQTKQREFGNVAKAIGVSVEELKRFIKPLLQEFLDEYFVEKK